MSLRFACANQYDLRSVDTCTLITSIGQLKDIKIFYIIFHLSNIFCSFTNSQIKKKDLLIIIIIITVVGCISSAKIICKISRERKVTNNAKNNVSYHFAGFNYSDIP